MRISDSAANEYAELAYASFPLFLQERIFARGFLERVSKGAAPSADELHEIRRCCEKFENLEKYGIGPFSDIVSGIENYFSGKTI